MSEFRLGLPQEPASARAARSFVAEVLEESPARDCADTARLLVSELVSNALLHARTAMEVVVRIGATTVRIEVHDGVERLPVPIAEPGDALAGRGLHIVDELAAGWGAQPRRGGKAVWFELPYAAAS